MLPAATMILVIAGLVVLFVTSSERDKVRREAREEARYVILADLSGGYEEPVLYDTILDCGWYLKLAPEKHRLSTLPLGKRRYELLEEPSGIPHVYIRQVGMDERGRPIFHVEHYWLEWRDADKDGNDEHLLVCEVQSRPDDPGASLIFHASYRAEPSEKQNVSLLRMPE